MVRYAIKNKYPQDGRWLGADDLAEIRASRRGACLSAWVEKPARVLFSQRRIAHKVCRQMKGTRYPHMFVVVRVPS